MKVKCRLCGVEMLLQKDQLKLHNREHTFRIIRLINSGGISDFVNSLLFECPDNPEGYLKIQQLLFDYVVSKECLEQ